MKVLQLVRDGRASPRIEPRPNDGQVAPEDFSTEDNAMPYLIGSQEIVEIAVRLVESNFKVLDVTLVNRTFTEIDAEYAEFVGPTIIESINGTPKVAEKLIARLLVDIFINDIRLRDTENGNIVTIGQLGVVHAPAEEISILSAGLNRSA